jgi:Phosphotransferase enzyme family
MLRAAQQALVELGALSPGDPLPPFSARMSGNLGLLFYLESGAFFLTKVGLLTNLNREYRGLTAAYGAMPRNVPEPLSLATYQSYQILVMRGVRHKLLLPLQSSGDANLFQTGIDAFLSTGAHAFRQSGRGVSWDKLRDALLQTSKQVDWPAWEHYWARIRCHAERLAPVLQHGDFAINNIGVSHDALIFFDWEDFGLIDLPGFDLAVLLLSLNNFSIAQLVAKLALPSMEAAVVRHGCGSLGISASEFMDLFPAYASLYIQTKSKLGYPPKVTDRVAAALAEWIRLAPTDAARLSTSQARRTRLTS